MRVALVRHGEAIDAHAVSSDALRYLTPSGRRTVRRVGAALAEHGVVLGRIFTSPLVRAVQTAEILASASDLEGPVEVWPALAGGSTAQALAALGHAADDETVALVGHEPSIRVMAAHLTGFDRFPGFRTGGVCIVDVREGVGSFQWALDPKRLERIDVVDDLFP